MLTKITAGIMAACFLGLLIYTASLTHLKASCDVLVTFNQNPATIEVIKMLEDSPAGIPVTNRGK